VAGSSRPRGFDAIRDERAQALERVRYRLTGGAQGTAPAGHLAAERRSIIGAAAARIMRKASGPASAGQIPKGTGSPLPADVKAKMEPKLGADLSAVRLHTGSESAAAATNFGARAFTVGNDIHFNAGQFAPGSKEGDKLLAHELTHVVQGQNSGIQRKPDESDDAPAEHKGDGEGEISDPDEPAEKEADAVAEKVSKADDENPGETTDEAEERHETKSKDTKEKAPTIGAKLEGPRIFRAVPPTGAPAAPAAPGFDEKAVRAKLAALGSADPDRCVRNLTASSSGPAIARFLLSGRFDRCRGFSRIISDLQNPGKTTTSLAPLEEACRLQDRGWRVEFEINEEGVYDVDVAAVTGDGTVARALAVKRAENLGTLANNLSKAAGQLVAYQAAQRWAVVHVAQGTMEELHNRYWGGVQHFRSRYSGVIRGKIVMPGGREIVI
jgi:hypothetical protein